MGFISGAFNKSVFDKSSYKAAIGDTSIDGTNGYAVIKIKPDYPRSNEEEDPVIIGVIQKDGLSFSLDANWQELGGMAGSIFPTMATKFRGAYEVANNASMIAGNSDFGAVAASRKIYQKSGYLKISPNIRIVDWKGVGQPIMSALILLTYITPSNVPLLTAEQLGNEIKELYAKIKDKLGDKATEVLEKFEGIYSNATKEISEAVDNVTVDNKLGGVLNSTKNQLSDVEKDYSLRSSPVPLTVSIGQFFKRSDMIIENVSINFSKEMTLAGPLYVDIDISMSSRKIVSNVTDIGIIFPDNKSRVYYIGASENSTGI
jgi:hypothetical protein